MKSKFDDNDHTITYWYQDSRCEFFKGLWDLVNQPSDDFKIKITHPNKYYEKHFMHGLIYLYVHKNYYLQLFQLDTLPLIMKQFLQLKNDFEHKLTEAIPLNQPKYDFEKKLKIKLFKHQRDNIC